MVREPRPDSPKFKMPGTPPIVWGPTEGYEWAKTAYSSGKRREPETPPKRTAKISVVIDFADASPGIKRESIANIIASECLKGLKKLRIRYVAHVSARTHVLSSTIKVPTDIDRCISFKMREARGSSALRAIALVAERRMGPKLSVSMQVAKLKQCRYRLDLVLKGVFKDEECERLVRGLEKRFRSKYKAVFIH